MLLFTEQPVIEQKSLFVCAALQCTVLYYTGLIAFCTVLHCTDLGINVLHCWCAV